METYKVNEIAKFLKVSTRTVRDWIKAGELPAINLGSEIRANWRITKEHFEQFKKVRMY